jgi:hypothetical protein
MYPRRDYLRENATFTRNDTWKEDLPDEGLLSGILLRMNVAGVSGAFAEIEKWRILDYISKVEIIANGSQVIYSITGETLAALMFFDLGETHTDYWHSYATGTKWCHLYIPLGRHMFDPEVGVDLGKYDNVELRITNDASSSYFGADLSLSVLLHLLADHPTGAFAGHRRVEEWRKYTTVADATEYIELPSAHPIRRVMLQLIPDVDSNNLSETGMWNVADDIELLLKSGALRVYKGGADDLMFENAWQLGRCVYSTPNLYMTADYGRRVGMGYVFGAVGGAGAQGGSGASTIPTIEGRRTDNTQKPETYEADILQSLIVRGICPENHLYIPFNIPDQASAYLDPKTMGTVDLNLHTRNAASAADGTVRVILDRYVAY